MINQNINIIKHSNRDSLFANTAVRCEQHLRAVLKRSQKASFIIPGGTTPGPAFEQLSKADLAWQNVSIAQSDERWLAADHPQSNQGLTHKTLLINQAAKANYVAMKNPSTSAIEGEAQCNLDYRKMPTPFSLTMLGMGLDGHIASLFPTKTIIDHALANPNKNLCMAIDAQGCEVAGDYPERMSLTFDAILNSELIIILMIGQTKIDVLHKAIQSLAPIDYPVSVLLNQNDTPVEIHWCE